MTSHKHLKDAVRARMARTGERYTTAHRHLTGAAPVPAPPGVVPGYRSFGGGRHHDSALLTNVLAAAGVTAAHDGEPLDEPMVAGLAGGIGRLIIEYAREATADPAKVYTAVFGAAALGLLMAGMVAMADLMLMRNRPREVVE